MSDPTPMSASAMNWLPIEQAPRDGTPILGRRPAKEGECYFDFMKVIDWQDYSPISMSGMAYLLGEGPRGHFHYCEHNTSFTFKPTEFCLIPK